MIVLNIAMDLFKLFILFRLFYMTILYNKFQVNLENTVYLKSQLISQLEDARRRLEDEDRRRSLLEANLHQVIAYSFIKYKETVKQNKPKIMPFCIIY